MAKPYMCGDETPIYVPGGGCDCNYTMARIESADYDNAYALMLNGEQMGDLINIPNDQVVQGGVVNKVVVNDVPYTGAVVGDPYLQLAIKNSDIPIYIPLKNAISGGYLVVDELPDVGSPAYIYLVPAQGGGYDRYIWSDGEWVDIGEMSVDLSNYYTIDQTDALLEDYVKENASGDASVTRDIIAGRSLRATTSLTVGTNGYATEFFTNHTTLSLGGYIAAAVLSNNSATTMFSIPLGRVMSYNLTLSRVTFKIQGRATNANGQGYYYITSSSSGAAGHVAFDSDTAFSFHCATGASKTIPKSGITISLEGRTSVLVTLVGSQFAFSGTQAIDSAIDNNGASVYLSNIKVYFTESQ